jgi:hypothetical protein
MQPDILTGGYTSRLTFQDRERLRAVVKAVHLASYPKDKVDNREADKLIDALGPEVCQKMIDRAMQRGLVS